MSTPVFIEGLDKTGKTTLYDYLLPRVDGALKLYDRGPWTPWVYNAYRGHKGSIQSHAWMLDQLPPAITVFLRRDLELLVSLQADDERYTLDALRRQEALYVQAFERWPPKHLIEVVNEGHGVEELGRIVEERLLACLESASGTPAPAAPRQA